MIQYPTILELLQDSAQPALSDLFTYYYEMLADLNLSDELISDVDHIITLSVTYEPHQKPNPNRPLQIR